VNYNQKAILLLVLLLVVATSWFFRKQESIGETAAVTHSGPDAYADNVAIRVMDAAGRPAYHLRTEHLAWYPKSDQLSMTRPQLEVMHSDGTQWRLDAEHGRTGSAGDPVWLTGEVIIQRITSASQKPLKITTSDVTVRPDARQAQTQQAAQVTGPGYRFEAKGLTADFHDNRLELHSQVRGSIDGNS